MRFVFAALLGALLALPVLAQADRIRLNQVGFYPDGDKRAVVVGAPAGPFEVHDAATGAVVAGGVLGEARTWDASAETVRQADFSALTAPGRYVVVVPGVGTSYPFDVQASVYGPVLRDAARMLYYQRASTPLLPEHAGAWARAAGHPDTAVVVHPSAATAERPAGSTIASPGGWYDAGDYGKYTTTGVMPVWILLALAEREPALAALALGLPESGDAVPDLVDEALWELRWLMTMQDTDGGVYHKLTTASFTGAPRPEDDDATRYVVQKTSESTFAAAAVFAQGARVLAPYADARPGLADSLRAAAERAWVWGTANPSVHYDQDAMNAAFDPDVNTGAYIDGWAGDDAKWAAAELFLLTGDPAYWTAYGQLGGGWTGLPEWFDPELLGDLDLWLHRDRLPPGTDANALIAEAVDIAEASLEYAATAPYGVAIGAPVPGNEFKWTSNVLPAWTGFLYYAVWKATGDDRYRRAIVDEADYLLGRNAVGTSFVTGWGTVTPQHPHHWMEYDGLPPIPGYVPGGPNPNQEDGCPSYPTTLPAKSYVDDFCAYASMEPAVALQGPVVGLLGVAEVAHAAAAEPPFPDPAAWYELASASSGRVLVSGREGKLQMTPNSRGANGEWGFVPAGGGAFEITNRRDGRGALEALDGGAVRWVDEGLPATADTRWVVETVPGGATIETDRGYLATNGYGTVLWRSTPYTWELGAVADTQAPALAAATGGPPEALALEVAPNPARGAVQVRYGLPRAAEVAVEVYDVQGRRVLAVPPAPHGAGWHAAALGAGALAPGVYAVRVRAGAETAARMLTVVR